MAASPPYKNVVKNGNFYHVYPGHKFRFIRKAGGKANHTGGTKAPTDPQSAQYDALLNALGLGGASDNADLISGAKALAGLKIDPQETAVDQAISKAAGAKEYLSQRMAKYQSMYQNSVNQGAQAAQAANTPAALGMSTGNAGLDQALLAQLGAQRQGAANQAGTIAQVAGMRGQDQQNQLAQEFQSQFNDLQQKRLGIEQQRPAEVLNALTGLADQKQKAAADQADRQMAADALGLKIDTAAETARHNQANEANTHRNATLTARTARQRLTSQEKRDKAKLEQQAREGSLNRAQRERLAKLKAKASSDTFLGPKDQAKRQDEVARLKSLVSQLKGKGHSRQFIAQAIQNDPKYRTTSNLSLSVALDLAFDGHVSRNNAKRLHDLKYKVGPLGMTYSQWARQQNSSAASRTGGN